MVFGRPESVVADPRLDREGKRAVLKSWEQDAQELSVAEEEGMGGGERHMLERVRRALNEVSGPAGNDGRRNHDGPGTNGDEPEGEPLRVRDVMRGLAEIVHVDQSIHEAATRMRRIEAPLLPVVDGDEIVGIVTAADVAESGAGEEAGQYQSTVRDLVSTGIAFCYDDDPVETAERVMERSGHRRLLVTDRDNYLVGLVTHEMIVAALGRPPEDDSDNGGKAARRIADTPGRAKGEEPGHPWGYGVRPKIKK